MPKDSDKMELERLGNLVGAFGWDITNQEFSPDSIVVTLKKAREGTSREEQAETKKAG